MHEWLEADGLGGFASGHAGGIRSRRYHALLLVATRPPGGRMVLLNDLEVWVTTPGGRFALSSHRYQPGIVYPDGAARIESFTHASGTPSAAAFTTSSTWTTGQAAPTRPSGPTRSSP